MVRWYLDVIFTYSSGQMTIWILYTYRISFMHNVYIIYYIPYYIQERYWPSYSYINYVYHDQLLCVHAMSTENINNLVAHCMLIKITIVWKVCQTKFSKRWHIHGNINLHVWELEYKIFAIEMIIMLPHACYMYLHISTCIES